MNRIRAVIALAGMLAFGSDAAQMRSRAEGVPGVKASNTVGLGDIWAAGGVSSYFRIRPISNEQLAGTVDSAYRGDFRRLYGAKDRLQRELLLVPTVGATVGLADYLHVEFQGVPWDGEKLGAATAGLKVTLPGNDGLRVFGLGASLNATLSTEEDIYSRGETTPGFDPILHWTLMADIDWIKVSPSLPVKLYANYSSLDDYRLVRAYAQHGFRFAAEYKGFRRGAYVRGGVLFYKPLATRFKPEPDGEYLPALFEMGFGYRARLGDRIVVTADIGFDPSSPLSFYNHEARKPPKVEIAMEAPLVFTETRAEAIRALIFNDERRKRIRSRPSAIPVAGKPGADSAAADPAGVKLDEVGLDVGKTGSGQDILRGVLDDPEGDVTGKRKRIREELRQIEELLE